MTPEQEDKFIEYLLSPLRREELIDIRAYCVRCGVTWPVGEPDMSCTCAPNEVEEAILQLPYRLR